MSENTNPSIEDALSDAFDEHSADDNNDNETPTPETTASEAEPTPTEEVGGPETDTPEPVRAEEAQEPDTAVEEPAAETDVDEPDNTNNEVAAKDDTEKAPGDWKPAAREAWKDVPDEVKKEIKFQQSKLGKVLTESGEARKIAKAFDETVNPFLPIIQASGAQTPMEAVKGLLGTASVLQMGTPQQKAQQIAKLVQSYGVGIEDLDSALSGTEAPEIGGGGDVQSQIQQAVAQAMAPINQAIGSRQQESQQKIDSTIETFATDPANEFFADVKLDMANILDNASRLGHEMSLEQAYERACKIHPEISEILGTRERVAQAQKNTQQANRHQAAASSVQGDPGNTAAMSANPADIEGTIRNAWDLAEAR